MKSFKKYLKESSYKKESDESEVLYHTSPHDIEKFHPLSHFGTKKAARHRGYDKDGGINNLHQYSIRLKLGNIKEIDDTQSHTPSNILDSLYDNGHISRDEHANLMNEFNDSDPETHARKLARFLNNKNIHTLSYKNDFEDSGKTSYIITHHSQVRTLKHGFSKISKRDRFNK